MKVDNMGIENTVPAYLNHKQDTRHILILHIEQPQLEGNAAHLVPHLAPLWLFFGSTLW